MLLRLSSHGRKKVKKKVKIFTFLEHRLTYLENLLTFQKEVDFFVSFSFNLLVRLVFKMNLLIGQNYQINLNLSWQLENQSLKCDQNNYCSVSKIFILWKMNTLTKRLNEKLTKVCLFWKVKCVFRKVKILTYF